MKGDALKMYTVYQHPADYPEDFIIRLWLVLPGGRLEPAPQKFFFKAKTLQECRAEMMRHHLFNLGREPEDEPHVVETWI